MLGYFITREMIQEREPLYTTDLFRGMAGIRLIDSGWIGTQHAVLLTGSRSISGSGNKCYPAVWMDGQIWSILVANRIPHTWTTSLVLEELAGLRSTGRDGLPVQYNINAACGVIGFLDPAWGWRLLRVRQDLCWES